jgi:hypothetical protein
VLLVAALMFGPMSGCYAHARGPGVYYESGYYGGGAYRGRDRYRYYRAPETHYRGGGGYYRESGRHHHHREHHHRHHHRGPRW